MSHGRKKPRQPRVLRNPIEHARFGATKLLPFEIKSTLAPALEGSARLYQGTATEDQHTVVYTALGIAKGIEASGVVRGLREHIDSALRAMEDLRDRAMASGTWRPEVPTYEETEAVREALHLHDFQLQHISAGELKAVTLKLIARATSSGGSAVHRTAQSLGLET